MSEILFQYVRVAPTTWVYLSSLLTIGLYFKFSRFWSVRNLDLILLILLAPGLLLVHMGQEKQRRAIATYAADFEQSAARNGPATQDSAEGAPATTFLPPEGNLVVNPAIAGPTTEIIETPVVAEVTAETTLREGRNVERVGFIWLLSCGVMLLIRLLVDPTMVRRPLLEPNLTSGGLSFIGGSLFIFLMANVITSRPSADDLRGPMSAELLMSGRSAEEDGNQYVRHGPGYALLFLLPSVPTASLDANIDRQPSHLNAVLVRPWHFRAPGQVEWDSVEAEYLGTTSGGEIQLRKADSEEVFVPKDYLGEDDQRLVRKLEAYISTAKFMAIFSHLAVVIGIVAVGYWHFNNIGMGIGAANLYLMLPYTAQLTGRIDHVLPAALLVWAIMCYRRPLTSGLFLGLATGIVYYPLFLLPLWISFYWQRGLMRFLSGVVSMLAVMVLLLVFASPDATAFWHKVQAMFGLMPPQMEGLLGIWRLGWAPVYRYPVLAGFVALSGTMAIWPAQKNLGTLLSCSAAVMVGTQFWHGYGGGVYMAWYLPLLLLTIFRPNLEDRVALSVLGEGWFHRRRRTDMTAVEIAA